MSINLPGKASAILAIIKEEVIVRLNFEIETLGELDKVVMAGKKMTEDKGENDAANVLGITISHFRLPLNDE